MQLTVPVKCSIMHAMDTSRFEHLYTRLAQKRASGEYDPGWPIIYTWDTVPDALERYLTVPRSLFYGDCDVRQRIKFRWLPESAPSEPGEPGTLASIVLSRTVKHPGHSEPAFGAAVSYLLAPDESGATPSEPITVRRVSSLKVAERYLELLAGPDAIQEIMQRALTLEIMPQPPIDHITEPTALAMMLGTAQPIAIG